MRERRADKSALLVVPLPAIFFALCRTAKGEDARMLLVPEATVKWKRYAICDNICIRTTRKQVCIRVYPRARLSKSFSWIIKESMSLRG